MTGSATLTTDPSIKAMLDPRMVATRTHSPTCAGLGAVSGAERMTPSSHGAFTKLAICGSPSLLELTKFCERLLCMAALVERSSFLLSLCRSKHGAVQPEPLHSIHPGHQEKRWPGRKSGCSELAIVDSPSPIANGCH